MCSLVKNLTPLRDLGYAICVMGSLGGGGKVLLEVVISPAFKFGMQPLE